MRITTTNKGIAKGKMNVLVKIDSSDYDNFYRAMHYSAILRAMRDSDENAFYEAMSYFVDDMELSNVIDWISKQFEGRDDDK